MRKTNQWWAFSRRRLAGQQLRPWEFVIIVFQLKSRWENTLKHNIMLLTCPWPSPSWSPPSWAACTLEIAIFSIHLSWNHLVAKNSQKRFTYVIVNNSLWQLLFIWKVAEKTHWKITLSYLSLTIFMLAALILMNVHLRQCYILKCKICDTNHEITRLLKTHKTLMKL